MRMTLMQKNELINQIQKRIDEVNIELTKDRW